MSNDVIQLKGIGKIGTVKVYNQAFVDKQQKRIAELEATNKKISDECHKLVDSLEKKQKEVVDLEKENAELKKMYHESDEDNNKLRENIPLLAEAKELLERLLKTSCNSDVLNILPNCSEVLRVRVEAEQFLSEGEK